VIIDDDDDDDDDAWDEMQTQTTGVVHIRSPLLSFGSRSYSLAMMR